MGTRQSAVAGPSERMHEREAASSVVAKARAGFNTLVARLLAPVDNSSIVAFRIAFGLIMLWEVNRYITKGWVSTIYLDPVYLFPYQNFEWVRPWPGGWLHIHFYALAVLAVMISIGLWYRLSAVLFWLGFTYVFLLDKGNYLNHLYLVTLISFLMIFVPANRSFSLDVRRRPELRSDTAPTWSLVLLASQFAVVYIYGGVAKLNGDWLRGEPMRNWMANDIDFPLIGRWFTEEWMVYVVSYSGLLLDLLIVPLLLWRKTRWFAVISLIVFHRFNAEMFTIGIFPTFATAAIILFLPPGLPRRAVNAFRSTSRPRTRLSRERDATQRVSNEPMMPFMRRPLVQRVTVVLVLAYIAIQVLVPLRFLLYPGNPGWTDQGDRFAWRMMLHSKVGDISYLITDPSTGQTWEVDPADYLTGPQRQYLGGQPDMILQFSHYLSDQWQEKGYEEVEVRAQTMISLNSRPPVPIVDPTVDLASEELTVLHADWITSLDDEQRRLKAGAAQESGS